MGSESSQLKQILELSRRRAGPEPGPEHDLGHEPWPRDWGGGGNAEDERALRALREGMARGRISGGARWEVPLRAAIAAAVLALGVVVAAVIFFFFMDDRTAQGVSIGESAPLVSASTSGPPVPTATTAQARVYVVGQVHRPGVVALGPDARVQDAIRAAGGATRKAALSRLNLARKVVDGERILVPKPGQRVAEESAAGPGAADGAAPGGPVDLNAATVAELDALPGVGPVLAGRIVEWRDQNGRFTTVDDLNEVSGIGDATMEKLRSLVRV